ncbi:class I SAM-dependent methyltransferase [Paenibacillus alvei]|uniref:Class I SAM-dependent methyltransferase n=1 Tax=Paenibacillus alvei TaxID=44250 RepID=A0ABT4GWH0_PAEAL|nr:MULTISPECIES: class I SAM-dependent methyltransferase [Paenibacillus]EJW19851.1 methyltransferase domain protein [Paenibacillus alvei DSM 29]MCY7484465.1 class I SAM-dependent methyltransferase [Paenibacillus alvei]MCY9543551.1 class I SAM-dependent methyltransferase [Paenibacillus alvei]MCY9706864.1 class I SAM-dependent methyltransferase [Paenibacillus alvei]MCY9737652.1 class I SAM-dependent methyltransferase [Paenibacillus alvei]
MSRVYNEQVHIDPESLKDFYQKRAREKISIDIDAPVVLCGDRDKSKIGAWTAFELEHRFPLLNIDSDSVVLEVGCGTGRISKYITSVVNTYVGVDYVKEFIDIIQLREDIKKKESTYFIHSSIQELTNGTVQFPVKKKFNRFIISGGVFMYINDDEVKEVLGELIERFDEECIIYISEPIALEERLTLNNYYSEDLANEYSAIYRTEEEYQEIFDIFYRAGFSSKVSEEFFYDDIKAQKETKQWMFILHRNK